MFEQITDVPAALAEFYSEEIRSEQVFDEAGEPVLAEETYTYTDENGDAQTGTKLVPTYQDVAYVVLAPRPQSVSWEKVNQIIEKHEGKRPAVVTKFTELAQATEKWQFHDDYLAWLEACAEINEYNATEQFDEEGNAIVFEPKELPSEPVFSAYDTQVITIAEAKLVRDKGQYEPITVDSLVFDADAISYEKMKGTITSWDTLIADASLVDAGIVVDGKLGWTLADNTVSLVTQAQLQSVVDAIAVRAALLQAQYMVAKA